MRFNTALLCGAMLLAVPQAALAGDKVLQAHAPEWVSQADFDAAAGKTGPAEILADWQHRIEGGVVYSYFDHAIRIDNPQTLMDQNILSLSWQPDKGDLTMNRLEIYRDGQVIDLLTDGPKFDVIRREQGLEDRLLDGELTATMPVPGLKVGDILRVAYTTSIDDQALGDETQVLQYLATKPARVGMSRAIVSWPEGEQMFWRAEDLAALGEPELRGGYRYLTVNLPLAQPKEVPMDAPSRYRRPPILRVGSFADWTELSRVMAPHFYSAAQVEPGSDVAKQAAAIMQATSDPLDRAARAVRLVQDQVSYLLNGLDGGNYLPQAAELTWDKRYGDCKAKSVLLLALLQTMGIDAEPVLVASRGGDALPYLLPVPGDFDHVIVHARIASEDYWLDGTSAGTRPSNIADVPPFFFALPLRAGGADLMPMTPRDQSQPYVRLLATVDHSAGIDFPQLFTLTVEMSGPASAQLQAIVDAHDPDLLRRIAGSFTESAGEDGGVLESVDVTYDKESATGRFVLHGLSNSEFSWEDGRIVLPVERQGGNIDFNPDRARPEWRTIPVATPGPMYMQFDQVMLLPQGGKGFSIKGPGSVSGGFANTKVAGSATLNGAELHSVGEVRQAPGEIAPADLPEARREARRFASNTIELAAPADVVWRWNLDDRQRRSVAAPIIAAYDKAIAFANEDDFGPLQLKAQFLSWIYDYPAALTAYNQLIEKAPSAYVYQQRSEVFSALGRKEEAIADLQQAYQLNPSNGTAFALARDLAYAGKSADALELLESLPVGDDERLDYADAWATVTGLSGDTGKALSLLDDEVASKPDNSKALNSDCWFKGLFNVALDNAEPGCTRAVERAEEPAYALDSRAMVQFRLGNYQAAIADLNAVLDIAPGLAPSRYMRGIARLKNGDTAGRQDIEVALRMAPQLADFYSHHGISPAR